ncbi:response regulator, partial [Streptomyces sp. NPDC006368]|uniref:response regulator n=1 Tax=Streptomyces sp. NPDC006368 TaxID=3156760 RepID=UPI0033A132B2
AGEDVRVAVRVVVDQHDRSGVPFDLLTDDSRLRQVLRNLLSNAVKFTERGSVELRIEPAADHELPDAVHRGGAVVAFRVKDTGIGIPEQQLESIFAAFQQADGTTSRKYGGTGLGLSISREIAHLLGGAVSAASVPGEGSTFTLYLPVARGDFAERPSVDRGGEAAADGEDTDTSAVTRRVPDPGPSLPRRQRRLLVIEERPRGLLSLVAESAAADLTGSRGLGDSTAGVDVITAVGAQEAAATLAAEPFHCVVLELDMAGGEALRFLDAVDGDPALTTVPVLAHNNRRLAPADERALQARADTRPLELLSSLDELRERITLHLSAEQPGDVLPLVRRDETVEQPLQPVDAHLAGRTVLVVDDDARNLYALSGILEMHGVHVLHAANGREGIEALGRHPGIDLILMDVMMPEMDGYAATAEIRRMPDHADLPIIAVTAKAMPGDQEKSLASGASDYVTKPVDANDLIARVRRWLT